MTTVKLLNVPFESNYKDTVYFANKQEQDTYMNNHVVRTFDDLSYQRKESKVRVPAHIDTLYNCNYISYKNEPYSSRTFYAFITDMEYKQDDCTLLTIKTDVIQTWLFDYTVRPSFVEREHASTDYVGENTIPENLEIGDLECIDYSSDEELKSTDIVIGTSVNTRGENVDGGNYNGIYSGLKYYSCDSRTETSFVNSFIKILESGNGSDFKGGKIDALQCIFISPKFLTSDEDNTMGITHSNTIKAYEHTLEEVKTETYIRNNKCLIFPYRYILVCNNNGGSAVYKYEMFDSEKDEIKFSIQGALTPGCSIRLVPKYYNGVELNNEEGLNLGKYPICNWNSDIYTNWLTQNSVNIGLNIASGAVQVIGGIATAVASGGVGVAVGGATALSGVGAIVSQLTQIHQMSFTPPQSNGNINCGDVITASETNTFHYYQMCVKREYLKIIDDFFQMFGYKTNRVKIPNTDHRGLFWYTKTIDVNIDGSIPNKDLEEIKQCYNNGITFWRANATMGDYNVNNTPLVLG